MVIIKLQDKDKGIFGLNPLVFSALHLFKNLFRIEHSPKLLSQSIYSH